MTKAAKAPVNNSNAEENDELPKTAVRPRGKDALIQKMQEQLATYGETVEDKKSTTTNSQPENNEPLTPAEEETFKKRYGDLRRYSQQKEAGYSKEINDLKTQLQQLTAAQNQPMPKTKEEFEAWKARFPDIVPFIEMIAEERATKAKQQLEEELTSVKEKLSQTEQDKAFATLKVLVPDLETVITSKIYKDWFSAQPLFVQEEIDGSDDPYRVAYYFKVFKASLNKPKTDKKDENLDVLNTATGHTGIIPSPTVSKYKFTVSQIKKMSPQEYEANEAHITQANKEGAILDDSNRKPTVFDV